MSGGGDASPASPLCPRLMAQSPAPLLGFTWCEEPELVRRRVLLVLRICIRNKIIENN